MILIDANIFMYAAGVAHVHKEPSLQLLERIALGEIEATTDVEVLQEILHRYRSIGRWEDGRRVFDLARQVVLNPIPLDAQLIDSARHLMDRHPGLLARDGIHAAAALACAGGTICSFDRDFDAIPRLTRVEPQQVR